MFLQILTNSLVIGSLYALISFGFSLFYNTFKFIPFFYGAIAILSAYLIYSLQSIFNFYLATFLSFLLILGIIYFLDFFIFEKFRQRKASQFVFLILSIALAVLFENLILVFWGTEIKTLTLPFGNQIFSFLSLRMTLSQLLIILSLLPILIISVIIIYFSKFGLKIRALVENQEMAEILGINKKRVFLQIFLLAALIAFLTGIFYGWEYALEPSAGTNLVIKSFTASIIAGLEIMPAVFFGGYLLAFIENFSIIYLPSSFKDGISFFILFLFLLLKPKGIFGRKKREEIVG
jgi:branched-chain amino acid transport system permease protein